MVVSLMANPDKGRLIELTCGMMNTVCAATKKSKLPGATLGFFLTFIAKNAVMRGKTVVEIVTSLPKKGRVI